MKTTVQGLSAAALLGATAIAGATSSFSGVPLHQNISSECISQHSQAVSESDISRASSIESLCPAGRPGNEVTTRDLQYQQWTMWRMRHEEQRGTSGSGVSPGISDGTLDPSAGSAATGLNAGEQFGNLGVWGNVTVGTLDDEFVNTRFDSDSKSVAVGADLMPLDGVVLGAAFNYTTTDVDTTFNGGGQDIDTYTGMLYAGALVTQHISIDGSVGYGGIDIDQSRFVSVFEVASGSPLGGAGAGQVASSKVDGHRWFGAVNLNGNWEVNKVLLNAHTGYLRSRESHDDFNETAVSVAGVVFTQAIDDLDSDLGQVRIGGEIGYNFGSFLEPFGGIDYVIDTTSEDIDVAPGLIQPSNDETEVQWSIGMRYFGENNGIMGSVRWTGVEGREDIRSGSLMLILRADL